VPRKASRPLFCAIVAVVVESEVRRRFASKMPAATMDRKFE